MVASREAKAAADEHKKNKTGTQKTARLSRRAQKGTSKDDQKKKGHVPGRLQ